jgi:mono/diheme cytochrome c family protein
LGCIVVLAAAFSLHAAPLPAAPARAAQAASTVTASAAADGRAFLDRHCVACHNERQRTANLLLDAADVTRIGSGADTWEKVVRKLRSGAMPPAGRRRPEPAALDSFVAWLETELDSHAAAHPNPGRVADHRLNRFEYGNAIRDLLALEVDPTELLPADESDQGFDNIAEVLSMSPTLLGRYMFAARRVSQLAVGDPTTGPAVWTFDVSRGLRQDARMNERLPYGTRGGTLVRHFFPLDGEYLVRIRLGRNFTNSRIRAIRTREEIDVLLDGALVTRFEIGGECNDSNSPNCTGSGIYRTSPYHLTADDSLEVRFSAPAGMHDLGVAFVRKSVLTEGMPPTLLPPRHTSSTYEAPRMDVDTVRLEGPFDPTGPGDTPSRRRIFVCRPAVEADEEPCAKEILGTLARRAYRRPATEADVETLMRFYRTGHEEGGFERGIQEGLARLLVSPQFLFRIERDPAQLTADGVYEINDLELASRLSFFLWSSIPDDELLDIAAEGRLRAPGVLDAQVRRMLADPRAAALARNFGGQWLHIRNLGAVDPDASAYPEFDDNLREAFERETELFIESQLRDDRPLTELLTADYSYLNERLARFYGVRNVYGAHYRRVPLRDPNRAGLLGHGSVLTVTSYATRTSPVVRGKYLLDNILGAPPPPPPPNVPALEEAGGDGREPASIRELMATHRRNPACASCHLRMDPLGFALENFDGIGRWRETDGATPIDASGVLPDGTAFDGPVEFREALLDRSAEFVRTFTEKLLTYALGRPVQHYDIPAVRAILREASPADFRWSSLVLGIVESPPFQMRRAREETAVVAQQ